MLKKHWTVAYLQDIKTRRFMIGAAMILFLIVLMLYVLNHHVLYHLSEIPTSKLFLLSSVIVLPFCLLLFLFVRQARETHHLREQLYQSQKMEAIGKLAGGIAHDFNNILASSTGYAELLADDLQDIHPKMYNFVTQILRANKQAQKLVEQILTFSRKQQDTELARRDIHDTVQNCIEMLDATMRPDIDFQYDITDAALNADINENMLHQLLMNFCLNAVDAMPRSGHNILSLKVEVENFSNIPAFHAIKVPQQGRDFINTHFKHKKLHFLLNGHLQLDKKYIVIHISDTGSGIQSKVLDQIFDPFFTTKDVNKGTGLGLAASRNIVNLHKGALIVSTQEQKGTCFSLLLERKQKRQAREPLRDHARDETPQNTDNKNILIVEDNIQFAGTLEVLLERMGYQTLHCLNALEALDLIEGGETFDAVLSDYKMPRMTGLEFAKILHHATPDIPIILMTGFSDEKIATKTKNTSIVAVLKKPIQRNTLAAELKTALAK